MARRTKSITLLALVVALVAAFSATTNAKAASATKVCAYKKGAVLSVITGASPALCRSFNGGYHGTPFSGHFGKMRCAFQLRSIPSILLGVFTEDVTYGKIYCNLLASNTKADWERVL
jgi:hypothetical protein